MRQMSEGTGGCRELAEAVENGGRERGLPGVECDHSGIDLFLGSQEEWLKHASSYLVVEFKRCRTEFPGKIKPPNPKLPL